MLVKNIVSSMGKRRCFTLGGPSYCWCWMCQHFRGHTFWESLPHSWRVSEMTMASTCQSCQSNIFCRFRHAKSIGPGASLCFSKTLQRRLSHCLIGHSVYIFVICNLSSIAHICFGRKHFSFDYAKKNRKIWRQLWPCNVIYFHW